MKDKSQSQYDGNYTTKSPLRRLILLVAFTGIMLIASTYAWFSVQNNVTLTGITGKVESVSGLEISLDGTNWKHELDLSSVTTEGSNIIPEELIPVSTTAQTAYADGIGQTDIVFYQGTYNDSTLALEEIAPFVNSAEEGYYQVDLYVKNTSDVETPDVISLNSDSSISVMTGGDPDTGIQNTVRLALAKYTGTLAADVLTNKGETVTGHTWGNIGDVAIWEPNAGAHVAEVYNNNDDLVLPTNYASLLTGGKFGATTQLPTFALTSETPETLTNVYDWTTDDVAEQYTLKTADTITTNTALVSAADGKTSFSIAGNSIVKVRLYLWLEGQDVDTINHASHGKGVTINLGLTKGEDAGTGGGTTLAEITNDDIGAYIDLGMSLVGTEATTDDWRILWVDEEKGQVYAMLNDYLPNDVNGKNYAQLAGLNTQGTYVVNSDSQSNLVNGLKNNWEALRTDLGIEGATVAGAATADMLQLSYNYNNEDIDYTNYPTLSGDMWVKPSKGDANAYWLASAYVSDLDRVWGVSSYGIVYSYGYADTGIGVCPVVCLSSDINAEKVEGIWTVTK